MNLERIAAKVAANHSQEIANILGQYERVEETIDIYTEGLVMSAQTVLDEGIPEKAFDLTMSQVKMVHQALEKLKPELTRISDEIEQIIREPETNVLDEPA
jgi:oligoendopeptidase F